MKYIAPVLLLAILLGEFVDIIYLRHHSTARLTNSGLTIGTGESGAKEPEWPTTKDGSLQWQAVTVDPVERLRQAAAKQRLYWQVSCTVTTTDKNMAFLAVASSGPIARAADYAEDGGKGYWFAFAANQGEAAIKLANILENGEPLSAPAPHKPTPDHKQCPPPVSGGPE